MKQYDSILSSSEANHDLFMLVLDGDLNVIADGKTYSLGPLQSCRINRMTPFQLCGNTTASVLHFELRENAARIIREYEESLVRA